MKLRIQRLNLDAKMPLSPYKGDAGMDVFSVEEVDIPAGEKIAVKTGLKLAIP